MGTEIAQWVQQASPAVTAAVSAYGVTVLTQAQNTAADATVRLGQRILQAVWRRQDTANQTEMQRVVEEAADERDDAYTAAVLTRLLKRSLQNDPELWTELATVLPAPPTFAITASGERSIAAQNISTAITGDAHSAPQR
ncbi:hypothetical protein FNV62_34390 [Streptomyces sp. RLB3-17]|uniref:hypothetical protein n=1 Tax=Streptomyces sp. RLB3-17 TaxID=2594455 RepID=UPI001163BEFE|nr:hypothetical protein [Streptomyces sp. RLB3-17]QDO42534.1 hypothetical protein FNV62_34390 [Streptomyces sp. RLB3-17]